MTRRPPKLLVVLAAAAGLASAAAVPASGASHPTIVTVGIEGNEPLVAVAPNGTVYISALQFLYKSTDHGAHFTAMPLPVESGVTEYKTDSDIAVDPSSRLYYTFDWPYAGSTSVCTMPSQTQTWSCSPAAFPGSSDRMWVTAPTSSEGLFVTNAGAYQPILSRSTNGGSTWTPGEQGASGVGNAYTGRPVALATGPVFQPVNVGGNVELNVYDRTGAPGATSGIVNTGLPAAFTGPSAAISPDGTLYVASEAANAAHGRGVVLARSRDHGHTWSRLPALPGTGTGTAIFTAVATGLNGHVGVLFYWSPESNSPDSMSAKATWYAVYLDTADANSAHPHWRRTVLEKLHHTGLICRGLGCDIDVNGVVPQHTPARFAGDYLGVAMDRHGVSYLAWMGADKAPSVTPVDPSTVYGVIHFTRLAAP